MEFCVRHTIINRFIYIKDGISTTYSMSGDVDVKMYTHDQVANAMNLFVQALQLTRKHRSLMPLEDAERGTLMDSMCAIGDPLDPDTGMMPHHECIFAGRKAATVIADMLTGDVPASYAMIIVNKVLQNQHRQSLYYVISGKCSDGVGAAFSHLVTPLWCGNSFHDASVEAAKDPKNIVLMDKDVINAVVAEYHGLSIGTVDTPMLQKYISLYFDTIRHSRPDGNVEESQSGYFWLAIKAFMQTETSDEAAEILQNMEVNFSTERSIGINDLPWNVHAVKA